MQYVFYCNISTLNLQIAGTNGLELRFKSNFFGTFSAKAFFVGPTAINFDEIFLNFAERLADAPHVLATFVIVILLGIILVVPLRKADKNDTLSVQWL